MYGHDAGKPRPSLYTKYTVLYDSILLGAFPSLAWLFCVPLHYYAKFL